MIQLIKNFMNAKKMKSLQQTIFEASNKKTTKENRMIALERLVSLSSGVNADLTIQGLIKRFTVSIDHTIQDSKEKVYVQENLLKLGEKLIPHLETAIKSQYHLAWSVSTLQQLTSKDYILKLLLEGLVFNELNFSKDEIEKNLEILNLLREYKHPVIFQKALTFLKDQDERVRLATLELLAIQDEPSIAEHVFYFVEDSSNENRRLRNRVIELFLEKKWVVPNYKSVKDGKISDRIFIDQHGVMNLRA